MRSGEAIARSTMALAKWGLVAKARSSGAII
jgi:hypothetical protein